MSVTRRLISAGFDDLERAKRFLTAPELAGRHGSGPAGKPLRRLLPREG